MDIHCVIYVIARLLTRMLREGQAKHAELKKFLQPRIGIERADYIGYIAT